MRRDLLSFLTEAYPVSDALKSRIASLIKTETIKKKTYLLKIGSVSNDIYFIEQGLVRICCLDENGGEITGAARCAAW